MKLGDTMDLKIMLEKKYENTFEESYKGFTVYGLVGVLYEESKEDLEARLVTLEKLAVTTWDKKDLLLNITPEYLASKDENTRQTLESQIRFAMDIKKKPVLEVYEWGEYAGYHYVVFNDMFAEACL